MSFPWNVLDLVKSHGTAVVAGLAAMAASIVLVAGVVGWLGAALAAIMLAIADIDARRFIIPDELNTVAFALGLAQALAFGAADGEVATELALAVLRAGVLALMFYTLRLFYARMRGREGLGLGDVKLAAVAGIWLDWNAMPISIEIAALSALAAFAVRHHVRGRPLRATTRLPFGLFFAPAIWLGWLIGATVLPYWAG